MSIDGRSLDTAIAAALADPQDTTAVERVQATWNALLAAPADVRTGAAARVRDRHGASLAQLWPRLGAAAVSLAQGIQAQEDPDTDALRVVFSSVHAMAAAFSPSERRWAVEWRLVPMAVRDHLRICGWRTIDFTIACTPDWAAPAEWWWEYPVDQTTPPDSPPDVLIAMVDHVAASAIPVFLLHLAHALAYRTLTDTLSAPDLVGLRGALRRHSEALCALIPAVIDELEAALEEPAHGYHWAVVVAEHRSALEGLAQASGGAAGAHMQACLAPLDGRLREVVEVEWGLMPRPPFDQAPASHWWWQAP